MSVVSVMKHIVHSHKSRQLGSATANVAEWGVFGGKGLTWNINVRIDLFQHGFKFRRKRQLVLDRCKRIVHGLLRDT